VLETELGRPGRCCVVVFGLCVALSLLCAGVVGSRGKAVGRHGAVVALVASRRVIVGAWAWFWRVDGGENAPSLGRAGGLHPSPGGGIRDAKCEC
jgi:hypothetical protein